MMANENRNGEKWMGTAEFAMVCLTIFYNYQGLNFLYEIR